MILTIGIKALIWKDTHNILLSGEKEQATGQKIERDLIIVKLSPYVFDYIYIESSGKTYTKL